MSNAELELEGQLDNRSIIDVIGGIYARELTGILELEQGERNRRFFFLSGELYLPGSHVLAKRLASYLDRKQGLCDADDGEHAEPEKEGSGALRELEQLVERIVDVLAEWRVGRYSFEQSVEAMPADVVGPLPTAYLIMEGAVRNRDSRELLQQLGGEDRLLVASMKSDLLTRLHGIDPEQMFLLSRAEEPIPVGELLRQVSIDREATLRKLCRLHAIGLLQDLAPKPSPHNRPQERLVDALVARFSSRIEERLEAAPVTLGPAAHRGRIAELLGNAGGQSHYEVLGVGLHAGQEEIYRAYESIARLVHPIHADRLGLRGKDAALRTLFERVTVAYLTLSDPERRSSYNVNAGIDAVRTPGPDSRSEEQHRLAQAAFEKALSRFEAEDYYSALELARRAAQFEPRAEFFALQARIEARNPHWLEQAAESYRRALRLDAQNADLRVALGEVLEQAGDAKAASVQYRVALKDSPGHEGAAEGLKRAGTHAAEEPRPVPRPTATPQVAVKRGLLGKIKGLFGG